MTKVEVLIAAMNQCDERLYNSLNLQTDAIIANQTDSHWYKEYNINGSKLKIISTPDRGVGRNRNIAILNATADICIIGDEDLIYTDNYREMVNKAFEEIPNADIIIFHVENLSNPNKRKIEKVKRVGYFNFARYGAARIAFKRKSITKKNIWFSLLYGGGAKYSAGEDTLFLGEAYRKGLKIYTYPKKLADAKQEESTWFNGYNEKYFFDKGVLLANLFPKMKYIVGLRMALKFKKKSEFTYIKTLQLIFQGIKTFDN